MGPRAAKSFRGFESLPLAVADIIKPRAGATSHIIHLHHTLSSQRSPDRLKGSIKDAQNHEAAVHSFFISEVLAGSKKYYSEMEKICYAVVMSVRKLRHYFVAHTIKVLTKQSLNDIFGNRDNSGRISKWAMELSEYVVDFKNAM
jgi:hypothetical protein